MLSAMHDEPVRVLIACVPQTGHVRPLLPLAAAFAAAGDEVLVASGPAVREAVVANDLRFQAVCPDLDVWFARLAERTYGRPGDGLPPDRVERYFVPRLFAEVGLPAMIDGLDEAVREFAPDLVICEPYALAAPLAAARHGVPAVRHAIGLPLDPLVAELVQDAVSPAWRAAGLAGGDSPVLTLDICPPTLAGAGRRDPGARVEPLRPAPLPAPRTALPVAVTHPGRPLVYVTLGTFANTDGAIFRLLLDSLADLPVSVLVTAGSEAAMAAVGEPPANATVAGFVPQAAVLPHCAAVIHHAGAGTAFGVLAHGLPSVAVPQSADNFAIARRLGAVGAAEVLMPSDVTADGVRDAVQRVLAEASYRSSAACIAAEIAAMPSATDVLPSLREVAAVSRPESREAFA